MISKPLLKLTLFSGLLFLLGCASVYITTNSTTHLNYQRDVSEVLVYDFTIPIELNLKNQSINSKKVTNNTQVAIRLSNEIVKELRAQGISANIAYGQLPIKGHVMMITGEFVDINAGDLVGRMLVGFGAGHSQLITHVKVYQPSATGIQLIADFNTATQSAKRPGMLPMTGVGAMLGHLENALALSTTVNGGSELWMSSNEKDAKRTAKEIVKYLKSTFFIHG